MKENKGKDYIQINSHIIQQTKIKNDENKTIEKFEKQDIQEIIPLSNLRLKFILKENKSLIIDFKSLVIDELTTDLAIPLYSPKYFKKAKISKEFDLSWANGLIIPIDSLLQFIF